MTVEEAHAWLQAKITPDEYIFSQSHGGISYKEQSIYIASKAQISAAKCQEALAVLEYERNKRYGFTD